MNLKTKLLEHQQQAVNKLINIKVGALFMEMGTGKTRTVIEFIYKRINKINNVVYFCPVALKESVKEELLLHTDITENDIELYNYENKNKFIYIVGLESISMSDKIYLIVKNIINKKTFCIVDESNYIRCILAKRTNRIIDMCLDCKYRIIMTGTPMSQGVVDLYSQMKFLSPKILGYTSFYSFARNHLEYSTKFKNMIVNSHNIEYIANKINPYTFSVTKKECLDLPNKIYIDRSFKLSTEQYFAYEQAKEIFIEDVDKYDECNSIAIFKLFNSLQQICSGFWNKKIKKDEYKYIIFNNKRIDLLDSVINDIPENEKIIIWAKYIFDIDNIIKYIKKKYGNDSYCEYTGRINQKDRHDEIKKFRNNVKFFIATQSCGGHGLTLNESCYTIFYSNSFKYYQRQQAEDRNHRIGQKYPVTYINLWSATNIENKIRSAFIKKQDLINEFKNEIDKIKNDKTAIKNFIKGL